jgi:hypothetical protein
MKRLSLLGFVGMLASVLAGCPIFSGDGGDGCVGAHCATTGTYVGGCTGPADCSQNETCGADRQCHSGDCTSPETGCVAGYTCIVDPTTQTANCVSGGTGGSGTGGSGTGGSTTSTGGAGTGGSTSSTGGAGTGGTGTGGVGGAPVYCGHPADCPTGQTCAPDGTCKTGDCNALGCIFGYTCDTTSGLCKGAANGCDGNTDCTGSGDVCIAGPTTSGGVCTQPADQCFDQSQCDSGDKCVAGKCVVGCATTADCRDGFKCDTALGTCSTPAKTCTVTKDCGGATTVCVGGACVPRSSGGTCASGDVWDENGCIPNQSASFTCNADGVQDACAVGSICLHHSCWISCDAPSQTICDNQPALNKCKPVTSSSGTHNVCGTSTNLGGMCDPTAGNNCSGGKVCVDGFCK